MSRRVRRRYSMLPALALFTLNEKSVALVLPRQQSLSSQLSSVQLNEFPHCHRRRKRSLFETRQSSSQDDAQLMRSIMPASFLQMTFQKFMPPLLFSPIRNDGRYHGVRRRLSKSLFMAQSPGSTGGFGKSDDKKKKRDDASDSSGSSKPKANHSPESAIGFGKREQGKKKWTNSDSNIIQKLKANNSSDEGRVGPSAGVLKGTSASSNSNSDSNQEKHKAKRSQLRSNKMNNYKGKNKSKSTNKKGKTKAKSDSGATTLDTDKSSIMTSDENTSLKSFKSDIQQPAAPQRMGQQSGERVKGSGDDLIKRVVQLEMIIFSQIAEIQNLRREVEDLTNASSVFSNVVDVLREAGLRIDEDEEIVVMDKEEEIGETDVRDKGSSSMKLPFQQLSTSQEDMEIFGIAPKSVTDAADAAGTSILSAILAGKHRMLVDVRDAELTRDPKLFVEFIELAILPVAAGLEGLDNNEYVRNRVKIVFPTVKELMSYRRSMALAAPEVVSLSTLGFDPVDERDKLIVVVAPSPDDMAGANSMEKLMARTKKTFIKPVLRITQPVVVLNHHMVPIDMSGFGKFTTVYHLRLLSVQYMTGDAMPEYVPKEKFGAKMNEGSRSSDPDNATKSDPSEGAKSNPTSSELETKEKDVDRSNEEDAALEAALTHAHEIGAHQGVTRAMVIRAYPKPWHVFVDTSPDTDADFEVVATFDIEPTQEDVNCAIVECLEGSEREDEIVAQQMQAALEAGQLNRVSDMLGISPSDTVSEGKGASLEDHKCSNNNPFKESDENEWDDFYYDDWFSEESV